MKKIGITKVRFAKRIRKSQIGHGHNIYDELVRIPLIFYNKDLVYKGKSSTQIRQIDIFPTIFDLLDIKYTNEIEGESDVPLIEGKEKQSKDAYMEAVGIVIPNKDEWLAGLRVDNKYK